MTNALRRLAGSSRRSGMWMILAAVAVAACFDSSAPVVPKGGCGDGQACSDAPVAVGGEHHFTTLAAGGYHTCGVTDAGEVWCWGLNSSGQLGATTESDLSGVPVEVSGGTVFTAVSAGEAHNCGLTASGEAWCWGDNARSELGAETSDVCIEGPCSRTPVRAAASLTFATIAAGASHTCGLDGSGSAHCWGYNYAGEVGSATFGEEFLEPVTVGGANVFTSLSAGFRFACALDGGAAMKCWGYGEQGQLATSGIQSCEILPTTGRCSPDPVSPDADVRLASVNAGGTFACAINLSGALYCWGDNSEGELGDGTLNPSALPVAVHAADGAFESVSSGYFHSCALRPTGVAFCWGLNDSGQLGISSNAFAAGVPVEAGHGMHFMQIVTGAYHTCGLAADGTAWCWGSDSASQLGRS